MSEWIEHTGCDCPFDASVELEIRFRDGEEQIDTVAETHFGNPYCPRLSCWVWESPNDPDSAGQIIAYRLHDNDEQAKREARIEMLRNMAQPNDYDVRPIKVPEREKVKQ